MADDTTTTEADEVRTRLIEHLESTVLLLDALDPGGVNEDLWSTIRRVNESTGSLLDWQVRCG